MSDVSLIMRIRSIFEGKAHAEAKREVEDLGKKAAAAGKSGADSMNLMAAATAAMNGNLSGVATGVVGLTGKMKLLGMSMMQLSLVAAVLTSLVKLFQAISDRAQQMAANLRAIQAGNVQAAVARITESYARMREETERAQKSRDKLFDANMKELEAVKKMELAQIGLNKQRELGTAKTDEERAAIESKYKLQEMDRAKLSDDAAAGFQRDLLGAKAVESEQQAQRDMQEIEDLRSQLAKRQSQASYAQSEASRLSQGGGIAHALSGGSRLRRAEGMQQEADQGRGEVVALIAKIEALQKAVEDNTDAAAIFRKQADVAGIDMQTSGLQDTAARTALATDDRMRAEREAAKRERDRAQAELADLEALRAAMEQDAAARRAAADEARQRREQAEASPGAKTWAGLSLGLQQARKEEEAAAAALRAYMAERAARDAQLAADIRAATEALRRIPNS